MRRGLAHVEHAIAYRVTGTPAEGVRRHGHRARVRGSIRSPPSDARRRDGERRARRSEGGARAPDHARRSPASRERPRGARRTRQLHGDLVQARELALDGAMWRLTWTALDRHRRGTTARASRSTCPRRRRSRARPSATPRASGTTGASPRCAAAPIATSSTMARPRRRARRGARRGPCASIRRRLLR